MHPMDLIRKILSQTAGDIELASHALCDGEALWRLGETEQDSAEEALYILDSLVQVSISELIADYEEPVTAGQALYELARNTKIMYSDKETVIFYPI
jgi:hypothetical protein